MKRFAKWFCGILAVLLVAAFAMLCRMTGSPKYAIDMLHYALPHMHRGTLKIGDAAPDARLVALDGLNHFHIQERIGTRPLVLVFGSFT